MRKPLFSAVAALMLALLAGCGPRNDAAGTGGTDPAKTNLEPLRDTLSMTVVPFEASEKLNDSYGPMVDYVAHKLGKKQGKFVMVNDYPAVVTALKTGQVDIAYISSLPYALASSQMKLYPIATPFELGSATYHSIVFVRANSPIKTIADLKGKTFAFGDSLSTSGYLLPRSLLERNGVPVTALKRWYNAGDANMVVNAVETGSADAGAAYQSVFKVAYKDHPEKTAGMRIIGQSEDIPNGVYVARGDLPPDEVDKLTKAFMSMNDDPEGQKVMHKALNDKLVPVEDKAFDHVRETAKTLGLDLKMFDKKKK